MSKKEGTYNVRALFEGEMATRFEAVKKFFGLQKNADLIRLLVTLKYEELRGEGKVPEISPPLEHFNLSEDGVMILDRTVQPPRIFEVYLEPKGAYCELCESRRCKHVKFALEIPEVRRIFREKGWKIE